MKNIEKINKYIKERAVHSNLDPFDPEADDGTFLMCYKDWRTIYDNLFCCIKFPEEWSGIRFRDAWTEQNSGGTPMKQDEMVLKKWAINPQYLMTITQPTTVFISLGQEDGRLKRRMKFPFKENINPVCFTIMRLDKGQKKIDRLTLTNLFDI